MWKVFFAFDFKPALQGTTLEDAEWKSENKHLIHQLCILKASSMVAPEIIQMNIGSRCKHRSIIEAENERCLTFPIVKD